MKTNEFIYEPKRIMRFNAFYLTLSVVAGLILCFLSLSISTSFATWLLLLPILVAILPGVWNFLKMIANYDAFSKLQKLANSESLVDFDKARGDYGRAIRASVVFKYQEYGRYIDITIWPNGVEHSDNVYELSRRISEVFGYTAYVHKQNLTSVTYRLNKYKKVSSLNANEF